MVLELTQLFPASITLTLPYPPSANRLWRVYRGRQVLSREAKDYKNLVAKQARNEGIVPLAYENLLRMTVKVYRPRKAGDLMNRCKILEDALNKIAFGDDEQIIEAHYHRHDDKDRPRVEVLIEVVATRPPKKVTKSRAKKALVVA